MILTHNDPPSASHRVLRFNTYFGMLPGLLQGMVEAGDVDDFFEGAGLVDLDLCEAVDPTAHAILSRGQAYA